MSDYLKREDVLDLIAGHTTKHDCPCAQLLATQVNDMAADPVAAAAIRLAEAAWNRDVTANFIAEALAAYRAAVEAAR